MRRKFRSHRPSSGTAGLVVGCLALFFALGGVGYAKKVIKLINGSTIKKGTIQVDRLSGKAQKALKGNLGPQGIQGVQGAPGAPGAPGGPGATGPPGPTASGYNSFDPSTNVAMNDQPVLSISSCNGACSGEIVMRVPGRLQVTAMADISSSSASTGHCHAGYIPVGTNTETAMGQWGYYTLPGSAADTDREVPVVASADVPAGTYDVVIRCKQDTGSGATFDNGDLNVVGIAT